VAFSLTKSTSWNKTARTLIYQEDQKKAGAAGVDLFAARPRKKAA